MYAAVCCKTCKYVEFNVDYHTKRHAIPAGLHRILNQSNQVPTAVTSACSNALTRVAHLHRPLNIWAGILLDKLVIACRFWRSDSWVTPHYFTGVKHYQLHKSVTPCVTEWVSLKLFTQASTKSFILVQTCSESLGETGCLPRSPAGLHELRPQLAAMAVGPLGDWQAAKAKPLIFCTSFQDLSTCSKSQASCSILR